MNQSTTTTTKFSPSYSPTIENLIIYNISTTVLLTYCVEDENEEEEEGGKSSVS